MRFATSSEAQAKREALLQSLGNACGTRPYDSDKVRQAAKEVEAELGEAVLVEAAAAVGGAEIATRCADMCGKVPMTDNFLALVHTVTSILRWLRSWLP